MFKFVRRNVLVVSLFFSLFVFLVCFVIFYFYSGVVGSDSYVVNVSNSSVSVDSDSNGLLRVVVYDNDSKERLSDVFVFVNSYKNYSCFSNLDGYCKINVSDLGNGNFSLVFLKDGYKMFLRPFSLSDSSNEGLSISVGLESLNFSENVFLSGRVQRVVFAKGTRSQDVFYYINLSNSSFLNSSLRSVLGVESGSNLVLIFNQFGENFISREFVNRSVKINGVIGYGFVGWRRLIKPGIFVSKVSFVE